MVDSNYPGKLRGKSLQAMTTEELEELLRQEQDADGMPDVDYIKAVLAALEAREEAPHVDVDAAWDDFKENYMSGEPLYSMPAEETPKPKPIPSKKKPLTRIAIIAAVLLVLVIGSSITASATGFSLWRAFVEWTSETLGIQFKESINTPYNWNPELHDLYSASIQIDMPKHTVPNYLPDGFRQMFIQANDEEVIAQYSKDDENIIIQFFRIVNEYGEQFQRDDGSAERYTVNGVDHMISTNMDKYLATWINEGWECSISGLPSKQELFRMIDSIYLEEKP